MKIPIQRRMVVQEAASWLWTPFHWHQCVKGPQGGCDCGSLLKACFDRVNLNVELPRYGTQFFMHDTPDVDLYLKALAKYCYAGHEFVPQGWATSPCEKHVLAGGRYQLECLDCMRMPKEVYPSGCKLCGMIASEHLENYPSTLPPSGDIVIFKMGRGYGHAGIIVSWPLVIHSCARDGFVSKTHVDSHPELMNRERLFYSIRPWHPEKNG